MIPDVVIINLGNAYYSLNTCSKRKCKI